MMNNLLLLVSFTQVPVIFGTPVCSDHCTDYHRICPAIKDPSVRDKLSQPEISEFVPLKELPSPVSCSNILYTQLCPASCNKCVPCTIDAIDKLQTQLTELQAKLFPPPVNPTPIKIVTGFASKCSSDDPDKWGIGRALDRKANSYYMSDSTDNPWANFYIPKSKVTSVKIKNRLDCCGDRLTGGSVLVCEGDSCQKCGEFGDVANGAWGTLTCGGDQGYLGSYIKVTVPAAFLQMAAIDVLGAAEKQVSQLQITGSTSAAELSSRFPLSASLDGNRKTFYHSKTVRGWAKYEVAEAFVTLVRVRNRPDCCNKRLMGAEVFVCADQSHESCKKCGEFDEYVAKDDWGVVSCGGDGIQGRFVKVMSSASNVLQISQIRIYGTE